MTLTGYKTSYCGDIREEMIGQKITLAGWVANVRDLGGIIFVELRDRFGIFQAVADPQVNPDVHKVFSALKDEYVIQIEGTISKRPEDTYNPNLDTGAVEMYPEKITVLSEAKVLPFQLDDNASVNEDIRLKYRYLDIRRKSVADNLILRHKVVTAIRDYLNGENFLEVETPVLINTTPEGARDYLVPSRVHANRFYALPQSPQIFKQLLMVGGIERYYQIAKCFRDEDLRSDRQPEFTQVDIEMSFVNQEDIINMMESLLNKAFAVANIDIQLPIQRLTHRECMDRFGSDRPDMRFGLELFDVSDVMAKSEFTAFAEVIESGGTARAVKIPGIASYSRKDMDDTRNLALSFGAKGLAWITYCEDGTIKSPILKYLKEDDIAEIQKRADAKAGDVVFFVADEDKIVFDVLGRFRLHFGEKLGLIDPDKHSFLWVTDFPMFEYSKEDDRYVSVHHPFTMPNPEDMDKLENDRKNCRSIAYDIVYNGTELGGGSVRIHSSEIQEKVFAALGLEPEEIKHKFGFLIDAFKYGTPPHAGIALGLDRLIALMAKTESIRDVIAFPKNSQAKCLMTDAPHTVDEMQLRELRLKLVVPLKEAKKLGS
ncbi:MAG: aspartate--tRNA ligase [Candidatus Gastranaerophilales bacterium]|nr:aspartate--tRNA ligase [Candidatus Gastranaerophilales bacterium]